MFIHFIVNGFSLHSNFISAINGNKRRNLMRYKILYQQVYCVLSKLHLKYYKQLRFSFCFSYLSSLAVSIWIVFWRSVISAINPAKFSESLESSLGIFAFECLLLVYASSRWLKHTNFQSPIFQFSDFQIFLDNFQIECGFRFHAVRQFFFRRDTE